MTPEADLNPYDLEDSGQFEAAAEAYAATGFRHLLAAHFQLDGRTRIGIGTLLQAISCDVRAGNRRRPDYLFDLIEPLLLEIAETADDPVLEGLSWEWRGDGATMLADPRALEWYRNAAKSFTNLTWEQRRWQEEPDFMHAFWAIERFVRDHGGHVPESPGACSFSERVETKLSFAEQFVQSE